MKKNKFTESFQLIQTSWKVLRANRKFFIFPVRSVLVSILITLIFLFPIVYFDLKSWLFSGRMDSIIVNVSALIVYSFIITTVSLYFSTALVCATLVYLRGGTPSLHTAFRIANDRLSYLFQYIIILSTVGIFFSWLEDHGELGKAASTTLNITWNLATFFVLPILVVENINPSDAIRLSANLLKETWVSQLIGDTSINLITAALIIGIIAAASLAYLYYSPTHLYFAWAIAILAFLIILVIIILAMTLTQIFSAVLYECAIGHIELEKWYH